MGWCHEFGIDIEDGCDHPMVADPQSCRCERCGAVCTGRFEGCAGVWERGPVEIEITRSPDPHRRRDRRRPRRIPDAVQASPDRVGSPTTIAGSETQELISTIQGLGSEVHRLTAVLELASRDRRSSRLMVVALDDGQPPGAARARTLDAGDATDLGQIEEVRSLVAAARRVLRPESTGRLHWRDAAAHPEPSRPPAIE